VEKKKAKTERNSDRRAMIARASKGITCSARLSAIKEASHVIAHLKYDHPDKAMRDEDSWRRFIEKRLRYLESIDSLYVNGVHCDSGCKFDLRGHERTEGKGMYAGKGECRVNLINYIRACYEYSAAATDITQELSRKQHFEEAEALLHCLAHHAYRPLGLGGELKKCGRRGVCTHCTHYFQTQQRNSMSRFMTSAKRLLLITITLPRVPEFTLEDSYALIRKLGLGLKHCFEERQERLQALEKRGKLRNYMTYAEGYIQGIHPCPPKSKSHDFHLHLVVVTPADASALKAVGVQVLEKDFAAAVGEFKAKYNYYGINDDDNSNNDGRFFNIKPITADKKNRRKETLSKSLGNTVSYLPKLFPPARDFNQTFERNQFLKGKHLVERFGHFKNSSLLTPRRRSSSSSNGNGNLSNSHRR